MKNIKIIMGLLAMAVVWSCDPLEDDIDKINESFAFTDELVFTLSGDDYEIADDACDCARFGNFSSEDDAKVGIAAVLGANYEGLGAGSSAIVTYDFFNGSSPDLRRDQFIYTVTGEEYDALGFRFGNFSNLFFDIPKYADFKNPDAGDGRYMDITHEYYDGIGTSTITSRAVYTVAYGWQYAWVLPNEAYGDFFGESGIDFSNSGEGKEKMPVYLNQVYLANNYAEDGDILLVQFNFDDRCFGDSCDGPGAPNVPDVGLYILTNGEWLLYNDHYQTVPATMSFGHDGTVWVPDNTIKITLGGSDYAAIAAATETSNPDGSGSVSSYGNFDVGLWTNDQIFEAITNYLLATVPSVDGQKYLVTYATWLPGAGTGSLHVIYSEADGGYILFE